MDIINIELASHAPHGSGLYHIAVTVCGGSENVSELFPLCTGLDWTGLDWDKWGNMSADFISMTEREREMGG